jgi:hypothetical protein
MMKKKIYVNNLPAKFSADDLCELCEPYGAVARIEPTDDLQDGSRRSSCVWLTDMSRKALHRLDDAVLRHRRLRVSEDE